MEKNVFQLVFFCTASITLKTAKLSCTWKVFNHPQPPFGQLSKLNSSLFCRYLNNNYYLNNYWYYSNSYMPSTLLCMFPFYKQQTCWCGYPLKGSLLLKNCYKVLSYECCILCPIRGQIPVQNALLFTTNTFVCIQKQKDHDSYVLEFYNTK